MPKFIFFLCLLSLPLQGQTGSDTSNPIRDITLNVNLLQNNPGLLAADTIGVIAEAREETYYKLSVQDEIIVSGRLINGENSLLITWPGMFAKTQTLPFIMELKASTEVQQKTIIIIVTIAGGGEKTVEPKPAPAREFTITMFQAGQLIGFRKKTMTDLIPLTTGLVTPVADPALQGSAIRSAPPSQSVSILGIAMGIAKYLAEKKLASAKKLALANAQKRKMAVSFDISDKNGKKKTVHAEIELQMK
jgi:hypothetical protein